MSTSKTTDPAPMEDDAEFRDATASWAFGVVTIDKAFFARRRGRLMVSRFTALSLSAATQAVAIVIFALAYAYYSSDRVGEQKTAFSPSYYYAGDTRYECRPMQRDSHYVSSMSLKECLAEFKMPDATNVAATTTAGVIPRDPALGPPADPNAPQSTPCTVYKYTPFESSKATLYDPVSETTATIPLYDPSSQTAPAWNADYQDACVSDALGTAQRDAKAIEIFTTAVTAMQARDQGKVCDWTKVNAPFICTKTEGYSTLTKLSLAYSNTMLVYGATKLVLRKTMFMLNKSKLEREGFDV